MINPPILRVAVPSPLAQSFDYLAPSSNQAALLPGIRVRVPFGRRELIGVVLEVVNESAISRAKLRAVLELIDTQAILSTNLLKFLTWASAYYHHPIGDVVVGTLPKMVRQGLDLVLDESLINISSATTPSHPKLQLNAAQEIAVNTIKACRDFQCFLLDGVTGSGKTEVYLQVIDEVLARQEQVLILVPEIGLTPQLIARFTERFTVPIISYHSGISEKKRFAAWVAALQAKASIIIGTRSALFLPLNKLSLIILDEEHDLSFKQQTGFRYSARDCAVMRAQLDNIPVVLGSATPSLESFYNMQRGRYQHLRLPERAGIATPPHVKLINLCDQNLKAGLSPQLLEAMHKHLQARGQILLFLNRRGFAPVCLCHHCGWIAECDRCDAKLTVHQNPPRLRCHHCDAVRALPKVCMECKTADLVPVGQGTEQLEQTVQGLFPESKVVRIDRDSTRTKGSMDAFLHEVQSGAAQILIGTQMLAKGHHFPNLTLAAIVDADGGLFSADFRALERMGQLIVQVAGRAGRAQHAGEVYIQTHHPEHPVLQLLLAQGYSAFMQGLLLERAQAQLPPFSHVALVRAEASARTKPLEFLESIKAILQDSRLQLLGPISAAMERKAGRFRAHLWIQAPRALLQQQLNQLTQALLQQKSSRQVRWSIDVDPQEGV